MALQHWVVQSLLSRKHVRFHDGQDDEDEDEDREGEGEESEEVEEAHRLRPLLPKHSKSESECKWLG
jgi:hypothetical protein